MGIVVATTDRFILFENGVRRNRLVLPGLSNAANHASARRVVAMPLGGLRSNLVNFGSSRRCFILPILNCCSELPSFSSTRLIERTKPGQS
jgi:hypothetical protein